MSHRDDPRNGVARSIGLAGLFMLLFAAVIARGQSTDTPVQDSAKATVAFADLPALTDAPTEKSDLPPLEERAQKSVDRANTLRAEQRYTEATIELEKALRIAGDDPRIHRMIALTQWEAGDYSRVERHIDAALKHGANDFVSYYLRGRLAARQFNNVAAIRAFRVALGCSHDASLAGIVALTEYHLAETLLAEGYFTAAIELYERFESSITALPDNALLTTELEMLKRGASRTARLRIATAYAQLGAFDKAANSFAGAYEGEAMAPAERREYIELLFGAERYDEARDAARKFVAEDVSAVDLLRRADEAKGDPDAFVADLRTLVDADPKNNPLRLALAEALKAQGKSAESIALLRDMAGDVAQPARTRWALFDALAEQGDIAAALREAAAAIRVQPEGASDAIARIQALAGRVKQDPDITAQAESEDFAENFVWGLYRAARGDRDAATTLLQRAITLKPAFAESRIQLGRMDIDAFRWKDAITAVSPDGVALTEDTRLETIRGNAYVGLDQPDAAVAAFRKALRLNRSNTEAMLALAELYRDAGQRDLALRQLQTLVEEDPMNERGREMLFELYLGDRDLRAAARQLDELRRISAAPTTIARCVAIMDYNESAPDVEKFRATLEDAIKANKADARTMHLIALSYAQEQKYTEAAKALEEACRLDPQNRTANVQLVHAYRQVLDFDHALAQHRLLMERYPNSPDGRDDEVELLMILQRFDEVIELTSTWMAEPEVSDRLAEVLREKQIEVYLLREDYESALKMLEDAWRAEPSSYYNLRRLIVIQQRAGHDEQAMELIRKWPKEIADGFATGGLELILQDLSPAHREEVLQLLLGAVETSPESEELQVSLIELLQVMQRFDSAIELAVSNASVSQYADAFNDLRLGVLAAAGRVDEAIDLVRERMLDTPLDDNFSSIPSTILRDRLIRLLMKKKDYVKARRELNRWLESASTTEERLDCLGQLAILHQESGDLTEALQSLERALEINPTDPGPHNDLGYSLADAGRDLSRADKLIRYAVAQEPRNSAYLDSLGWVLYKQGEFDQAKLWLTRARFAGLGEDPVVCDHLADACWRLGLKDEARKWWTQSVKFAKKRAAMEWSMGMDERTLESVQAKLDAIDAGNEPKTAPLGEAEAAG